MNDRGPTGERSEKTHHEIDGVIRRQYAEVAQARPEGIERSERDALLQIVFVRHHAAFGASASPRGVDNAGRIPPAARNENRFADASKLFPVLRAGKNSVCRRLGNKNRLDVRRSRTAGRNAEMSPNRIFSVSAGRAAATN